MKRVPPPSPGSTQAAYASQTAGQSTSIEANKVIRNTYALLSMTLLFSAFTALVAMQMNLPPMNPIIMLVGAYGLMFLTHFLRNSVWGLAAVFAFTGFMGVTLGPVLNYFMAANAGHVVALALSSTGAIFLALSGYTLVTRKDFSFLSGFLFAGFVVLVIAMIAGIFIQMPALQLAISAGFALFSAAAILYQTSALVHGQETNYISATVTLYVQIYNLFLSLLHLIGAFGGDD